VRLLLTALNCPKGQIEANEARHHELLTQGRGAGCDLVLLPEMSLTGYRASAALSLDDRPVWKLVEATADGPALCFGLVEHTGPGTPPYITQLLASGGRVVAAHRKAHLGEGEHGPFQPGNPTGRFSVCGVDCTLAVCSEIGAESPYRLKPALVLGPSAPGLYGLRRGSDAAWRRGFEWWRGSVVDDARRLLRPGSWLAVSSQAGATEDEDFPGWAALVGFGGDVVAELPDWREGALLVDVPV
jgi:NAD+ synthase (glutamine-hydrolysing)